MALKLISAGTLRDSSMEAWHCLQDVFHCFIASEGILFSKNLLVASRLHGALLTQLLVFPVEIRVHALDGFRFVQRGKSNVGEDTIRGICTDLTDAMSGDHSSHKTSRHALSGLECYSLASRGKNKFVGIGHGLVHARWLALRCPCLADNHKEHTFCSALAFPITEHIEMQTARSNGNTRSS